LFVPQPQALCGGHFILYQASAGRLCADSEEAG
jgi:hypothetical protein